MDPIGPQTKKKRGYPKGKAKNGKYPEAKTFRARNYGPIIGYVRVSFDPLTVPQGAI